MQHPTGSPPFVQSAPATKPTAPPQVIQTANGYTFLTKWGSFGIGDGQFSQPEGIAVDSSGNVYVADYNNDRVQKFNSNGNFITKWGSSGISDGQLSYLQHIAVDSSGNVYVADGGNNRIQVFAPS